MNEYLGDGLHVSFDGFQFRLYTDRMDGTHEVYLDPGTLNSFQSFIKRCSETYKTAGSTT